MKSLLSFLSLLLVVFTAKAQFVSIPDPNFRAWLVQNHPTCMNANQEMDVNCVDGITSVDVSGKQISNLDGIQYFDGLETLNCVGNQLASLPTLPSSLTELWCSTNQLTSLPTLPSSLSILDCYINQLTSLPTLPSSMQVLDCRDNQLTSLPTLPSSLTLLWCYHNQLTSLPTLSSSLQSLNCANNHLASLPTLPSSLQSLNCAYNQLTSLPTLPSSLTYLNCYINQLTSLPTLPSSLQNLDCSYNQLTNLPTLPSSLTYLNCYINQLTSLPALPSSLFSLYCHTNQLTSLPALPSSLFSLYCHTNQLTSLPALPSSLQNLDCAYNQLVNLPTLPSSLHYLGCDNNQLTTLPILPISLTGLNCTSNPITCFPLYYGQSLNASLNNTYITCVPSNVTASGLPTCTSASQICGASVIAGKAYIDNNANGSFDTGDQGFAHRPISADDGNGNMTWAITDANGDYNIFVNPSANPYIITNPVQNNYYLASPSTYNVLLNSAGMTSSNNDFLLIPNGSHHDLEAHFVGGNPNGHRPGFDVGYDLYYQNQGTTTQDAQLVFTADAGLTFVSSSVAPTSISGNVYTWDFMGLNPFDHGQIQLVFNVPTTFVIGQFVNASLDISSVNVDETPSDNLQTTIYPIINGYDPNDKQVSKTELSPSEVAAGRELSYLIRFQNTGNAEAINIMITDELSQNLDIASLEILGSSHDMVPQLSGAGKLQFYFANIMLPDSNTNEPASHGYIAYRIKPKTDLVVGDQIDNTANIYFDYNPAIVTNTVTTTVVIPTGKDLAKVANLTAYPVPVMNELNVEWAGDAQVTSIEISNLAGQVLSKQEINSTNTAKIDFSEMTQGVYLISLMNGAEKVGIQKVVK